MPFAGRCAGMSEDRGYGLVLQDPDTDAWIAMQFGESDLERLTD